MRRMCFFCSDEAAVKNLPSRELTYPTKREKENHLQNAILGGYVSSLEGKLLPTVFALNLFFPEAFCIWHIWSYGKHRHTGENSWKGSFQGPWIITPLYRGDITPVTYENKVIYGEAPVAPYMTILTMPVLEVCISLKHSPRLNSSSP